VVHIAVEEQNEKLLQYLITEPGVNLNVRDSSGQTPLYLAVSAGLKSLALMLAENGADIEGQDDAPPPETGLDDEIDAAFQVGGLFV
jgi:ankyrin repeat protein